MTAPPWKQKLAPLFSSRFSSDERGSGRSLFILEKCLPVRSTEYGVWSTLYGLLLHSYIRFSTVYIHPWDDLLLGSLYPSNQDQQAPMRRDHRTRNLEIITAYLHVNIFCPPYSVLMAGVSSASDRPRTPVEQGGVLLHIERNQIGGCATPEDGGTSWNLSPYVLHTPYKFAPGPNGRAGSELP